MTPALAAPYAGDEFANTVRPEIDATLMMRPALDRLMLGIAAFVKRNTLRR